MTRKGLVALSIKTKNMFWDFRILTLLPDGGVSNIVCTKGQKNSKTTKKTFMNGDCDTLSKDK